MVKSKHDIRISLPQNILCVGIAGILSKTLTAPLDVLKINTQVGTPLFRQSLYAATTRLYQREGWRGFWKGNLIGCLRLYPHTIIQLAAFHRLKLHLSDECGRLSPWTAAVVGAGAGLTSTAVLYPTDTIKTRLIVQDGSSGCKFYNGIFDAFRCIIRDEGFSALYRGMSTTLLGVIPFSCGTFLFYYLVNAAAGSKYKKAESLSPAVDFTHGCMAVMFAHVCSCPFDTIRKKMQAWSPMLKHHGDVDVNCINMRTAVMETIQRYGTIGLWRGCLLTIIKVIPYTGLMFLTYEATKHVCLYHNGFTDSPFFGDHRPGIDQRMDHEELQELLETDHTQWEGLLGFSDEEQEL